jgi:phage head maturation protease
VDWWDGEEFIEELSLDPAHVRLGRLNGGGANLLDSHSSWRLASVLGVVERAWIEDQQGVATVRFSERAEVVAVWQDVVSGILRNISVGYFVHRFERTRTGKGQPDILRAVDWEPAEISLVAVPADAGAGVRDASRLHACQVIDTRVFPHANARRVARMDKLRRSA